MTPRKIGLTSTLPVEVLFAAGHTPVDLNNIFIESPDPGEHVRKAEQEGFPRTVCSWIKGIYSVAMQRPDIDTIIGVTQGDCSNTHALLELLAQRDKSVLGFEFPRSRERRSLEIHVGRLMARLGADWDGVLEAKRRLDGIRAKLNLLDELTWRGNRVSGEENHLFLVSASDFRSDPGQYERELDAFLAEAEKRPERRGGARLGFLGVPPIVSGLYGLVEELGGRVVFNEVQRQFSMPYLKDDLMDQYLAYTYPYDIGARIRDIRNAVQERALDGLIHYTQSFCFRQIQDILLREQVGVPILTLEGDRPGPLDAQVRNRIEAFLEVSVTARKIV